MTGTDGDGRAYDHEPGQPDLELTLVGRGTPGGELLRRYWMPVAPVGEVGDTPSLVRVLGEDLVLFRDGNGRPGLLYPRCCHRGTTLYYGRVEDAGLRCSYHGWLFDVEGRCVDQPCEVDGGRNRDRYRQPWYPVVDYHGLLFAYLGPAERQPVFPRYDIFEDFDPGTEEIVVFDRFAFGGPSVAPCNWFQTHENAIDPFHVFILHNAISGPQFHPDLANWPEITWERTAAGVLSHQYRTLSDGRRLDRVTEVRVPNVRVIATPTLSVLGRTNNMSWALPIDDTHTRVFALVRNPKGAPMQALPSYGPDAKTWEDLTEREHQRYPGDYETQVGQGPITLHSEERLAASDRGVSLVRRQFKEQVEIVRAGGDPAGVSFAPADAVVTLRAGNYVSTPEPT